MRLTFFGVRGSCPCAGDAYRRVGGNTSCALVSVSGDPPLVLDLGSGLRALGETLRRAAVSPLSANALLTHLHMDHVLGLPFFTPLQEPGARLTLYGPAQEDVHLREALVATLGPPLLPVKMVEIGGELDVREVADETFPVGRATVRALRVPHPGITLGFRVEVDGRSVAYLPDHQAPPDRTTVAEPVLELCEGADVLVHDGQLSEEEFAAKPDWGHSTVAYAARVAAQAGVRRLYLFHHDPAHTDRDVGLLLRSVRRLPEAKRLELVSVATEGSTVPV